MEKTMQLSIEIKMTRLADLLCSAFEGGIGYWARIEKYKEPTQPVDLSMFEGDNILGKHVYPYIHYPLSPDGAVIIGDIEGAEEITDEINGGVKLRNLKKYTLNMKVIKKGLNIFAEKYPRHFGDWLSENDDATTGDVFIQCCLFGEVIYG